MSLFKPPVSVAFLAGENAIIPNPKVSGIVFVYATGNFLEFDLHHPGRPEFDLINVPYLPFFCPSARSWQFFAGSRPWLRPDTESTGIPTPTRFQSG